MPTKLEIFDDWVAKNNKKILEMIKVGGYQVSWVQDEFKEMRVWIIGNPNRAPQKLIGKFISGWLRRSWKWHHELKNPITKQQEDDHYEQHKYQRYAQKSDMTSTGDILKNVLRDLKDKEEK